MRFPPVHVPSVVRFVITLLILVLSYLVYSCGPVPFAVRGAAVAPPMNAVVSAGDPGVGEVRLTPGPGSEGE